MNRSRVKSRSRGGFTIVEILVVIAIIGILATISIVSYGAWRRSVTAATIKSDLNGVIAAMESYRTFNNSYPATVPSSFTPSSGVILIGGSVDSKTYCVDGTSSEYESITFYVASETKDQGPLSGTCATRSTLPAPDVPSNLAVTSATGTAVNLSWAIAANAATYTAQCASDAGFIVGVQSTTVTAPTTTVSSLAPSTTYYCRVNAVNINSTSAWSTPVTSTTGPVCPSGFIVVPGNSLFSTTNFCVMKYEAKITGNDNGIQTYSASFVPESRASGTPWVNISQTNALTEATTVVGCTGCHLITENEWLTIAHNVLSVPSNWSSGTVGTGYIYRGHSDAVPANSLAADTNDNNGYTGTGQSGTSEQKRTLTLTNGEVIWDMAGNVYDWTQGTIGANLQPGLSSESAYAWKQWNNPSLLMNGLAASAKPSYGTPAASAWTSTQNIGQLYSNYGETTARAFLRGGGWSYGGNVGVFFLLLYYAPDLTSTGVGFRVSQ